MTQKPPWLKVPLPSGENYLEVKSLLRDLGLHTVCEEARCPNIGDCWNQRSATIMIMGDTCTRSCGFCAVKTGRPLSLDGQEPERVALALQKLALNHVVVTSVDRDDLEDGGSEHFAETICQIKRLCPQTILEVLIPDFRGKEKDLMRIFSAKPDVLNHNLETVASLQKQVRPQASYDCSLKVLRLAHEWGLNVKSGLMLGLGETQNEIETTLYDLCHQGKVSILTLGQYLQPTKQHLNVQRYYSPEEFEYWKQYALDLGFSHVASGPLVRSSFHEAKMV